MGKKNKNAAKKRADQRRRARTEAREHVRAQNPNPTPTPDMTKFLHNLGQKMKEAKEAREREAQKQRSGDATGQLPKPDYQGHEAEYIHWRWDVSEEASVSARYYTCDSADGRFEKGGYYVGVQMVTPSETFTPDKARRFGEALISAHIWEDRWQAFTGEYLANGGWSDEAVDRAEMYDRSMEHEQQVVAEMDREPFPGTEG
ncbi:hypothetical protein PBI_OAKER_78 [Mycobacterium phage Oaker]|uniref:hypothetical protein n=1 Tax=Mycobacterium phage Oaker TaxID=1445727 RepID=UPI0003E3E9AA|nr:hypothetical protein CH12_gp78 [Mycobacterium phage Oaker]AHG24469.1 hypothetical protein PBI_OAKER_78 [Mycobacterium phage Oaker]